MKSFLLILLLLLHGCTSSVTQDTQSLEGAQRVFFSDRCEYSVGDFVLSLPIGYYEATSHRLIFAQKIIETGSPKPVIEQEKYLVLEEDALAPKRHFLLLDQRHLLIYSEYFQLADGYPAKLEVLRRTGDAGWTDISDKAVPKWARSPKKVDYSKDHTTVVVIADSGKKETLAWSAAKLEVKR